MDNTITGSINASAKNEIKRNT